jgi:hypothetical protein
MGEQPYEKKNDNNFPISKFHKTGFPVRFFTVGYSFYISFYIYYIIYNLQ